MSEEATAELTEALQNIPTLRLLDLSLNDVGAKAAKNLGMQKKKIVKHFIMLIA